jgi:hypothetical protein
MADPAEISAQQEVPPLTPAQPIPEVPPPLEPVEPGPINPQADQAPEAFNASQDDEDAQSQTVSDAARFSDNPLAESEKVASPGASDDVQDLVDHMNAMVQSGIIDMDAFRGERNDDDEEGSLGPAAGAE